MIAENSVDKTSLESLERNFIEVFGLPGDAVEWLLKLYEVLQVFDDIVDGDPVPRYRLDGLIFETLVGMQVNSFYQRYSSIILPHLTTLILKWKASDDVERKGDHDEVSFVWRAGYYDLVLLAVHLCYGSEKAMKVSWLVMKLYGEKYEEYKKEF